MEHSSSRTIVPGRRARGGRRLTALAYHRVSDGAGFQAQLDHLVARAQVVPLDGVLRSGEPSVRPLLLTFDDGDPSLVETAAPILRRRELPATAFLVAGTLDTHRPYWWQEVETLVGAGARLDHASGADSDAAVRALKWLPERQRLSAIDELRRQRPEMEVRTPQLTRDDLRLLEASGIEIGNHTMTHPILSRCSDRRVEQEIREAHEVLTDALGHPPRAFAFPDRDWDPRVKPILRELGYEAAFLFDHRRNRLPLRDPLAISRVRVSSQTPMRRFRMVLRGIHPTVHHLLGRP